MEAFSSVTMGRLPSSCDNRPLLRLLSSDFERVRGFDWERPRSALGESAKYDGEVGMTRRKKKPTKHMANVPTASSNRKCAVSSSNAIEEIVAKKKALRPNAASGKAVAVPRWLG